MAGHPIRLAGGTAKAVRGGSPASAHKESTLNPVDRERFSSPVVRSFLIALALLVAVAVLAGAPGQSAAAPSSADVYAWGFGGGGELGNGGNANSSMPGPVSLPTGVTASNLSAGRLIQPGAHLERRCLRLGHRYHR